MHGHLALSFFPKGFLYDFLVNRNKASLINMVYFGVKENNVFVLSRQAQCLVILLTHPQFSISGPCVENCSENSA